MIRFLEKSESYQLPVLSEFQNLKQTFDELNDDEILTKPKYYLQTNKTIHYIVLDYDDSVRLGVTIHELYQTFNFWVEVKSHVPFFADSSKSLTWAQFIEEVEDSGMEEVQEEMRKYLDKLK